MNKTDLLACATSYGTPDSVSPNVVGVDEETEQTPCPSLLMRLYHRDETARDLLTNFMQSDSRNG